jgi:hypothetical protein
MKLALLQSKTLMVVLVLLTVIVGVQWGVNLRDYYRVDFAAYWSAGRALNEGVYRYSYTAQDAEGNNFQHAMFLNPPVVAHPFRLIGIFPFKTAKEIWYYTQILLFVGSILLLAKNNKERVILSAITVIGMPFIFWPLFAELERGETNMLILALVALGYYLWRQEKLVLAGLVLGCGSVLKFPLLLIFSIPFALKQWKLLFAGAITFIGIFILSLAVDGTEINKDYFVEYLPGIAIKDHLPDHIYSARDTPKPPTTRWEGETYITRYKFEAASGSAARFFRSWSNNRLDRSLIIGGAGITALIILVGAYKVKKTSLTASERRLWEDIAWSAVIMATLILHTLSWITNYVVFIFVILLLWRFAISSSNELLTKILKYSLLIGTVAIVIGDPVITLMPHLNLAVDILIRNRVWLGGMLIWGILLVLLVRPKQIRENK